jgi:DNA-binding NtrC family response regulator
MKNVLLILDSPIEFDLTRTILFKLGFNILSLKKGSDMYARFREYFPDIVITSVLGTQDEMLVEFVKIREKRGIPKFIWVGSDSRMKKLSDIQLKVIDANLTRPLQPEQLIRTVCTLLELPADELVAKYFGLLSGSMTEPNQGNVIVSGEKAETVESRYNVHVQNVEHQDKVFTAKDLMQHNTATAGDGNTEELLNKKKEFLKSLFKKK